MADNIIYQKAPGKILWFGGYSILEKSNIGFVTSINSFVNIKVIKSTNNQLTINVPQFGINVKGSIDLKTGKISIQVPKELILIKTAIEISLMYVISNGTKIYGFSIESKNDSAMKYDITTSKKNKTGMGSSAALVVATTSAILRMFGESLKSNDALHKLSQVSHSLATGKVGSGFDIAASTYGPIIYSRYSKSVLDGITNMVSPVALKRVVKTKWDYSIKRINFHDSYLELAAASFEGHATITTSLISKVYKFRDTNPEEYNDLIKKINEQSLISADSLSGLIKNDSKQTDRFKESFEEGRLLTKRLGVLSGAQIENDECTKLIEKSNKNGAFVTRLPGAGGKDSIVSICVNKESKTNLERFWRRQNYLSVLDINLEKSGAINLS